MKSSVFAITLGVGFAGAAIASHRYVPIAQASSAPAAEVQRVIQVEPARPWVNVRRLETIRFVVGNGANQIAFVRRIDGNASSFALQDIAPAGVTGLDGVKVYVAPDRVTRR